jgi:MFS transporter, DHA2 family, multidrug resistance protein
VAGLTPLEAGLWSLPSGLGFIAGSLLTAPMLKLMRPAHLLALGLGVAAIGLVMIGLVNDARGLIQLVAGSFLMSLGMSPCAAVAADLVVSAAPAERAGSASGLNETSSEFGGALGIALLGALLTAIYRNRLLLPDGLDPEIAAAAERGLGTAAGVAEGLPDGGVALLDAARTAYMAAMQVTSFCAAALVGLAAVTAFVVFRGRLRPTAAQEA